MSVCRPARPASVGSSERSSAGEAAVVEAREAEDVRGEHALRVRAPLLGVGTRRPARSRCAQRISPGRASPGARGRRSPSSGRRAARSAVPASTPERARDGEGAAARVPDLPWVRVDGHRVLADGELGPGAVVDRPASRRHVDRDGVLAVSPAGERLCPYALQPHRAPERGEQERGRGRARRRRIRRSISRPRAFTAAAAGRTSWRPAWPERVRAARGRSARTCGVGPREPQRRPSRSRA